MTPLSSGVRSMGLDISASRTGVIVSTMADGALAVVHKGSLAGDGKGFARAHRIAQAVADLVFTWEPDIVVIEGYAYGNAFSLATLVEIGTLVRLAVWQSGRAWLDPAPATLKKFVTGHGHASKEKMVLEVFKRWGIEVANHDEADGLGLSAMGLAWLGAMTVPHSGLEALATCRRHAAASAASPLSLARAP